MDPREGQHLEPELRAAVLEIDWSRVLLDSWGDGWPWPVGPILDWLETAVRSIEEWIRDAVFNPINDAVHWAADRIWEVGDWLRDRVFEGVNWIRDHVTFYAAWLRDRAWEFTTWLQDRVGDWASWLRDRIVDAWTWIRDHVTFYAGWLRDRIVDAWTWIRDHVTFYAGWLRDRIVDAWTWIRNHVSSLAEWLRDRVVETWTWVRDHVSALGQWLGDRLQEARDAITAQIAATLQWFQDHVVDPITDHLWAWWNVLKEWAVSWVQSAWRALQAALASPLGAFSRLFANVGNLLRVWIETPGGFLGLVERLVKPAALSIGKAFIEDMLRVITDAGPALPGVVVGPQPGAGAGLFQNVIRQIAPRLFQMQYNLFLNTFNPAWWVMDKDMIKAMATRSLGFQDAISAYLGPVYTVSIGRNQLYAMNEQYRNAIPSVSELNELFARHKITPELHAYYLSLHGEVAALVRPIQEAASRELRLIELMRYSDVLGQPDAFFTAALANAGYDDEAIPLLLAAIRANQNRGAQANLFTQLRRLYSRGYLERGEVTATLTGAGNPVPLLPEVAAARAMAMDLELEYQQRSLLQDVFEEAFAKGAIDEDELDLSLASVVANATTRGYLVQLARWKRTPKVKTQKDLDPNKLVTALQREYFALYVDQFRSWVVDADELHVRLLELGLTDEYVSVVVQREQVRRDRLTRPEKLLYQTDLGRAEISRLKTEYGRGLISDADVYSGLVALEMPDDLARSITATEVAKVIARPVRPPAPAPPYYRTLEGRTRIRALELAFRADDIAEADYREQLRALAVPADYADALVDVELARKAGRQPPVEKLPLPLYQTAEGKIRVQTLRDSFRRQLLTPERLEDALLALEMPQALVAAIVEQELVRAFMPPEA